MNADAYEISSEEIKNWILSRDFPPLLCELPMHEQIVLMLQNMGFERVRVVQVPHHPVFRATARLGRLAPQGLRPIKFALRRMCRELGFVVKLSDIIAEVRRDRLDTAFGLIPPNVLPVEVEDDGHRVPEHLDFEEAI